MAPPTATISCVTTTPKPVVPKFSICVSYCHHIGLYLTTSPCLGTQKPDLRVKPSLYAAQGNIVVICHGYPLQVLESDSNFWFVGFPRQIDDLGRAAPGG